MVHAARTWTPADMAAPPADNIDRVPMLEALLGDGRARFVGGALSPRLNAVWSSRAAFTMSLSACDALGVVLYMRRFIVKHMLCNVCTIIRLRCTALAFELATGSST